MQKQWEGAMLHWPLASEQNQHTRPVHSHSNHVVSEHGLFRLELQNSFQVYFLEKPWTPPQTRMC